jgi:hypothetical protein
MKTFSEIAEMHYASEPSNEFDKQYKRNRIDALEKLLTEQLTIPVVSSSAYCNCGQGTTHRSDHTCGSCGKPFC